MTNSIAIYEGVAKMAQNDCDRETITCKDMLSMSKWPNWVFTFEFGHFGILESLWSCTSREDRNGPIQ